MKKIFQKLAIPLLSLYMALWFIPSTEVTGRIALVGTAMFYDVVIITEKDETIYFDESLFEEFLPLQNQTITISAKIRIRKLN